MNNEYLDVIKQVKEGFQATKGKGYCFITNPIPFVLIVFDIIISLINKRPNIRILVVLNEYKDKTNIVDAFNSTGREIFLENVKFLSLNYADKTVLTPYDCVIFINPVDDVSIVEKVSRAIKFALVIFKKPFINNYYINRLNNTLKEIPIKIDKERLNNSRIYSPVEEYRHKAIISEDDLELSKKYDAYIKDSISIFGDLKTIEYCRSGNPALHQSAMDCRYVVAYKNGWSNSMDKTIEINQQIDALYNPNALRERASITYNVVRERNELITDYEGKLEEINKIIKEHPDERFLIISKRSEFATAITDYLNMNSTSQICASCHNKLVPIDMLDSYGKPVLVKSGVSKGKPRMLGAQAQCTKNLQLFRSGKIKAISTNSSPDKDLDMDITSIIITSPSCQSLEEYLYRLSNVRITNPVLKLYNIYCTNTSEEKKLNIKMSQNHKIINKNEQNVVFDENCGVIVC